jgi:Cu-Zn family superoxide dismutase
MRPIRPAVALAALLLLPACASKPPTGSGGEPRAGARLRDAAGKEVGEATLVPAPGGVKIDLAVKGVKPGTHAFHVHAAGKCEAPDFKSAGPHFNPAGKQHGHANPQGAHAGDLPNVEVGADGSAKLTVVAGGVTLGEGAGSLFPPGGTSVVLHADPDDGKTDPAGNAGARIACGVVERR